MADAAVEFLLDNLKELLLYHVDLIKDVRDQVEKLEHGLRLFKVFLRDSTKSRRNSDTQQGIIRHIHDVVYEAEDIIDAFVTQAAQIKFRNSFIRAFRPSMSLRGIATQVERISQHVNEVYRNTKFEFERSESVFCVKSSKQQFPVRQENVVGFEDETEKIIGYLCEERNELDVISVIGMPGLGKTTLARKIFLDKSIEYEFPTRIWVYVSQEFTKRDVYLDILRQLTRTEDMDQISDQELCKIVYGHLERGKFLIVMDDLWTTNDWDEIQVALPKKNSRGKVMITSRNNRVALHANKLRAPHKLRLLTRDESWLLLQLEVFRELDCPSELVVLGKIIASQCNGLPLAIVVIGTILVTKSSSFSWKEVSEHMNTYYLNEDPVRRIKNIMSLSYDNLPSHLRACFLYLGMFPEDFEIPVWKLIRLWIAEGFIQQKEGISLEETAEDYLYDLISRNLVVEDRRRPDGKVKTCRIHDMLRDFCKNEAGSQNENFFKELKMTQEASWPIDEVKKYRRICIHSNAMRFFSHKPIGAHVRTFACFAKEDIIVPAEYTSTILAGFQLLRVLDVRPLRFTKIPSDIYLLVHLRYIVLSIDASFLPAAFAKLWNIQTLIVDTTSRTLEIKADVWTLSQLRHLETNASAILPKAAKGTEGKKLQSLGTISPNCCTKEVFDRARNLKKLGIRGKLALLLEGSTALFDNLGKLSSLEKLKLINDVFPFPISEGKLRCLPPAYKFPPNLRRLTLLDTFLDWNRDMPTLALLMNLEVLKLKNNAFMGSSWEVTERGFHCLEVLLIEKTDLMVWVASSHHFPRLRHLELHNCEKLMEIPLSLADVPNFQCLDLYRSVHAVVSAKKIRDAKQKKWEEQDTKDSEFKLILSP